MQRKSHPLLDRLLTPRTAQTSMLILVAVTFLNVFCLLADDSTHWFGSLSLPYDLTVFCARIAERGSPAALYIGAAVAFLMIGGCYLLAHLCGKHPVCFLIFACLLSVDTVELLVFMDRERIIDLVLHLFFLFELFGTYFYNRQAAPNDLPEPTVVTDRNTEF